jgi:hypothetical protein
MRAQQHDPELSKAIEACGGGVPADGGHGRGHRNDGPDRLGAVPHVPVAPVQPAAEEAALVHFSPWAETRFGPRRRLTG